MLFPRSCHTCLLLSDPQVVLMEMRFCQMRFLLHRGPRKVQVRQFSQLPNHKLLLFLLHIPSLNDKVLNTVCLASEAVNKASPSCFPLFSEPLTWSLEHALLCQCLPIGWKLSCCFLCAPCTPHSSGVRIYAQTSDMLATKLPLILFCFRDHI